MAEMDMHKKLMDLYNEAYDYARHKCDHEGCDQCPAEEKPGLGCFNWLQAQYLIAHGVTVQELDGCFRCKDSQKMTVTISNKLIDGVNTGWLGGNLPARYCPFCGRRLSQPPKE